MPRSKLPRRPPTPSVRTTDSRPPTPDPDPPLPSDLSPPTASSSPRRRASPPLLAWHSPRDIRRRKRRIRRIVLAAEFLAWAYLLSLLALWLVLSSRGDHAQTPPLLLFGPHWPWALPLAILAPFIRARRRLVLPLLAAAAVLLLPLMAFSIPIPGPQ